MNTRQRELHAAVIRTSDDPQTQLDLLYEQHYFAARYGASTKDVKVVHEHIVGGTVRECAG